MKLIKDVASILLAWIKCYLLGLITLAFVSEIGYKLQTKLWSRPFWVIAVISLITGGFVAEIYNNLAKNEEV